MVDLVQDALVSVKVPTRHDRVYKDECMFSFDTPETPTGLYTSLTTWQSFGADYVDADFQRHGNHLYLKRVCKRLVTSPPDAQKNHSNSPPSKIAIAMEGGFDPESKPFTTCYTHSLVVLPQYAEIPLPNQSLPTIVNMAIHAIINHDGFQRSAEVASAWQEEDRKESKYAAHLPQLNTGKKVSPDPKMWRCEQSGMTENLWLNLSTGYIGSGRKAWDGSGGTGAALDHYENTGRKYPLAVKLGTITSQGADVYSYASDENEMVLDPFLSGHLSHWGINMQLQTKTEKTMTELQIDLNASYQFDKITESGSNLVPLHGPGYVGLQNLGNSCYMASIVQILFSIPEIEARFKDRASSIFKSAPEDPGEDILTMMAKMGVGLLSDKYTKPIPLYEKDTESSDGLRLSSSMVTEEYGSVVPFMFKNVIGKGHVEFSSGRQQDVSEFFQYFLDKLARGERAGRKRLIDKGEGEDSFISTPDLFRFELEERIEDTQTGKVRYITRYDNIISLAIDTNAAINKEQYNQFEEQRKKRQKLGEGTDTDVVQLVVPLSSCLEAFAQPTSIEHFTSPETGIKGIALKRTRFKTFPEYLVIHLKRYFLGEDWTPRKLDASVPMPEELDLSELRGTGVVNGEILLSEEKTASVSVEQPPVIVPDPSIVSQLIGMGFSENGSKRAALATNNSGAEASMEWVFAHMEDADFNEPIVEKVGNGGSSSAVQSEQFSQEAVASLTAMSFTGAQAKAALKATGGSLERAADWLFSHSDNLDAAVSEVEGDSTKQQSDSNDEGDKKSPFIDGLGKYELLGFASHLGSNTSCGHYVAHIKKEERFVLFNDEKVALSQNAPTNLGFLYVYRRKKN